MTEIRYEDTTLSVWSERDRLHVALYHKNDTAKKDPFIDIWDDDARQAFEDGFLRARFMKDEDPTLKQSAFSYAKELGRLDPANRVMEDTAPTGWVMSHPELGAFLGWYAGPKYIWSKDAADTELERGAYAFPSEEEARCFFAEDSAEEFFHAGLERMKEIKEFLDQLSAVEVVLDIALEGHAIPRRASIESIDGAGIDLMREAHAPSAPKP